MESRKNFVTDVITDFFEKGRSDHCKGTIRNKKMLTTQACNIFCVSLMIKNILAHRYLASNNDSIEGERTIDFYDSAQFNGLSRIEMGRLYLTEHYVDREDLLYYR